MPAHAQWQREKQQPCCSDCARSSSQRAPRRESQKRTGTELVPDEEQKSAASLSQDLSTAPVLQRAESDGEMQKVACPNSDRGTLAPTATLAGTSAKAGVSAKITVTPGTAACKCDQYRWLQVADIIPGKWNGRDDAYVDPFPNDDTKPYYWTDTEEAASPNTFTDPPSLLRSRSATEGSAITNQFETACMCLRAGQNDKVIGAVSWGYTFDTDQAKDKLIGPTTSSGVSKFWTDAVTKDFGAYKFDP